jgi:hypothetical protein
MLPPPHTKTQCQSKNDRAVLEIAPKTALE